MITHKRVKELLDYKDGNLIRKVPVRKCKSGCVAGTPDAQGYMRTTIDYKSYRNHRLVWLWHNGYMPENNIDHIDQDKTNNRIENLREVSRKCNARNTRIQTNNTSKIKGVGWHKASSKWRAYIKVDNKQVTIGSFNDFFEAVAHRLAAEQCLDWSVCESSSTAFQYVQRLIHAS